MRGRGCLFTESGFRVGFPGGFSSWIFELGYFWRDFLAGFPINFQWFYTTYSVSGVAHRLEAGAHQMEPPSLIQALGVNPLPSRFIIRTVPRGDFARRRWEAPITTTK